MSSNRLMCSEEKLSGNNDQQRLYRGCVQLGPTELGVFSVTIERNSGQHEPRTRGKHT